MGQIFKSPEGIDAPDIGDYTKGHNFAQYEKDCDKFVERVKQWVKKHYGSQCPEAGKEIQFGVGDGYARYVVVSLKPVKLIHLDVGDAWQYQYVHRLTAADIRKELKNREALNKLFSKAAA